MLRASKSILQYYLEGSATEGPAWTGDAAAIHIASSISLQHDSAIYIRKHYPDARVEGWDIVKRAVAEITRTGMQAGHLAMAIEARCGTPEHENEVFPDLVPQCTMAELFDVAAFDLEQPDILAHLMG